MGGTAWVPAVFSCLRPLTPCLTWVVWISSWESSLFLSQGSTRVCYQHLGEGGLTVEPALPRGHS